LVKFKGERFTIYKNIFNDKCHKYLIENLEKDVLIYYKVNSEFWKIGIHIFTYIINFLRIIHSYFIKCFHIFVLSLVMNLVSIVKTTFLLTQSTATDMFLSPKTDIEHTFSIYKCICSEKKQFWKLENLGKRTLIFMSSLKKLIAIVMFYNGRKAL